MYLYTYTYACINMHVYICMAMGQNPGTDLGELQNSWDLWLFIYPKCDTLGFDPWLCNATYNHSNGIFVAISNGIWHNHFRLVGCFSIPTWEESQLTKTSRRGWNHNQFWLSSLDAEAHVKVKIHLTVGRLLEVHLSKKCTQLWREAHFEVNMLNTSHVRTTFGGWDVEQVHAVVVRSTFWRQKVANTQRSDHSWTLVIFPGRCTGFCALPEVSQTCG